MFNSVMYRNHPFAVKNTAVETGDQVAVFYCGSGRDHSETSMLVSAGFESYRPVNS
jgi:hypothetical protein